MDKTLLLPAHDDKLRLLDQLLVQVRDVCSDAIHLRHKATTGLPSSRLIRQRPTR